MAKLRGPYEPAAGSTGPQLGEAYAYVLGKLTPHLALTEGGRALWGRRGTRPTKPTSAMRREVNAS